MNRRRILSGALLAAGLAFASQVQAFSFLKCGDGKVVWNDNFVMVQNLPSIQPFSAREGSLDNAIARWRGVIGMDNMVSKALVPNLSNSITNGDGQNDAAIVLRSSIGGNNGLTLLFNDGCFFGGDMEWTEADVMVASDLTFGPVAEDALVSNSGRSTFIHEFGHAHGLLHAQTFNHMRVPQPRPVVGGPGETMDILPDDAQGGRFLYPSGNTEINLFASAQRRQGSSDSILLNNTGTATFCSSGGQSISLFSTVGNNGTIDVQQTEKWWVSTSSTAHNGGLQIGQSSGTTFLANKVKTRTVTFTLPALPIGTYFLYHRVDVLTEVDESRTDDNTVREAMKINIVNC